jgi:NUMOD3 motif
MLWGVVAAAFSVSSRNHAFDLQHMQMPRGVGLLWRSQHGVADWLIVRCSRRQPLSSSCRRHAVRGSPTLDFAMTRFDVFGYPALQPKLPIEDRLRAQGLPESEIMRRKKISDSARGRVPWNKGKKHSAGVGAACRSPFAQSRQHRKRNLGAIELMNANSDFVQRECVSHTASGKLASCRLAGWLGSRSSGTNRCIVHCVCRVAGEHQDRHAGGDAAAGGAGQGAVLGAPSPDAAEKGKAGEPCHLQSRRPIRTCADTPGTCCFRHLRRPWPVALQSVTGLARCPCVTLNP